MPQNILKQTLSDQEKINSNSNHCQNEFEQINLSKNNQGFLATIACKFNCLGSKIQTRELKENFSTTNLQMKRGDGNLWAGLSTILQIWSSEKCLLVAQENCGSLDKVDTFENPKISSGNWKLDTKLGCNKIMPTTLSPFDKSLKTEAISYSSSVPSLPNIEINTTSLINNESVNIKNDYIMPDNCKKKISGDFCFGDCTLIEGKASEFLSTAKPIAKEKYTFCADELITKLKKTKLSDSVLQFYCEDYFISTLKSFKATGLTCASSRITVDCSDLKNQ